MKIKKVYKEHKAISERCCHQTEVNLAELNGYCEFIGRTSYRRFIRFHFEERCIGNSILLLLVNSSPLDFNNCSGGQYLTPN